MKVICDMNSQTNTENVIQIVLISIPYLFVFIFSVFVCLKMTVVLKAKRKYLNRKLRLLMIAFLSIPILTIVGFALYFVKQILDVFGQEVDATYETVQYLMIDLQGVITCLLFMSFLNKSKQPHLYYNNSLPQEVAKDSAISEFTIPLNNGESYFEGEN